MNLIYLSPHFPPNYVNFTTRLKSMGVQVLGIAADSYDSLPADLKWGLTEYHRVEDMNNYAQVLQAGMYFKGRYGTIDRIESHTEYWLPVEAALREDLQVWGKNCHQTEQMTRKSAMKATFQQLGIETARGRTIEDLRSAEEFCMQVGYPIIIKPDIGVGAANTWRVNNPAELARLFEAHELRGYFMEEFVDGAICTFDGLTDGEGNIVYHNGLTYNENIMEIVLADSDLCFYTARQMADDLVEAGMRTVKAFDVREKFFHLEFFRRHRDQKLLGLEVNIRAPGVNTIDMWNYADDVDFYSEWARIVSGGKFQAQCSRRNHVAHVGRKDNAAYLHSHDEVVAQLGQHLLHFERLSPIFQKVLGDVSYLIRAANLKELLPLMQFAHQRTSYSS